MDNDVKCRYITDKDEIMFGLCELIDSTMIRLRHYDYLLAQALKPTEWLHGLQHLRLRQFCTSEVWCLSLSLYDECIKNNWWAIMSRWCSGILLHFAIMLLVKAFWLSFGSSAEAYRTLVLKVQLLRWSHYGTILVLCLGLMT